GAEDDMAGGRDLAGGAGRAGEGAVLVIDGEVVAGEPAGHGRLHRLGLDHRLVPGVTDRLAQLPGAVGGVAIPCRHVTVLAARARGGLAGWAGPVPGALPRHHPPPPPP